MINVPNVKLGIVAVSRDCFPADLSTQRRQAVVKEVKKFDKNVVEIKTVIENENDVLKAFEEIKKSEINALVIFLGNFGPEGPETLLAGMFAGPVMFAAAAEESTDSLIGGRGDAYCGMLNASYNLALRNIKAYIPEYPVGTAKEIAEMIKDFAVIARVIIGVKSLKIFGFGPRPHDFLACNAPIKPFFDLGVNVMENSELDLYALYKKHENDKRIPTLVKEMENELKDGNCYPGVLSKLAQYELTLQDFYDENKGACKYAVFANKCWPAFQTEFGFVPCYVNSRFAAKGIPIACETDLYGALTEYILTAATNMPATLLDINNSVPADMYKANKNLLKGYENTDLFMGFHCGNTPICHLKKGSMKYQLIMHRLLEPDKEPDVSRGTLEGAIAASDVTLFRLQSTADGKLRSYVAEGNIMDIDPMSFGAIGVFAIKEMGRFYRHVLIGKNYPHHAGVGFMNIGKILYAVLDMLGVEDVDYNRPKGVLYPKETPFK